MVNSLVLLDAFCANIFCDDFSLVLETFFAVVKCELFDFSLYLFSLFAKVLILSEADLNSFLVAKELGENPILLGEFMLMFWVWVKVMFVLVVILG